MAGTPLAWLLIIAVTWLVTASLIVFGPLILRLGGFYLRAALAAGWVTAAISVPLDSQPQDEWPEADEQARPGGSVAPHVFIAGLICRTVALLVSVVIDRPLDADVRTKTISNTLRDGLVYRNEPRDPDQTITRKTETTAPGTPADSRETVSSIQTRHSDGELENARR